LGLGFGLGLVMVVVVVVAVVVVIVMVVVMVAVVIVVVMIVVMLLRGRGLGLRRLRFSADGRYCRHPNNCHGHDKDFLQHSISPVWVHNLRALAFNSFSNERALNGTP
jgi:hypothetical protein